MMKEHIEKILQGLQANPNFTSLHFNYRLFVEYLIQRGVSCRQIPGIEVVEARYAGRRELLLESTNRLFPAHYVPLLNDKVYAKTLLAEAALPINEWKLAVVGDDAKALADQLFHELGSPLVIKPPAMAHGDDVYPMIEDRDEFLAIWRGALEPKGAGAPYIVEKHFEGDDYRFFVMKGQETAVLKREPPFVIGDGISTIEQLVAEENQRRMNPRSSCLCEIYLGDYDGERCLRKQGLCHTSILEEGRRVRLRYLSNVSYGGLCENVTHKAHPDYLQLAERVFDLFPGAPYIAVDMLAEDIETPYSPGDAVISELGSYPGFSLFLMPSAGESVDVITPIVERLFPEL